MITIECTDDAPSGPGPYAYQAPDVPGILLFWLTVMDGKLMTLIPGDQTFEEEHVCVTEWKGKWRRLVPA